MLSVVITVGYAAMVRPKRERENGLRRASRACAARPVATRPRRRRLSGLASSERTAGHATLRQRRLAIGDPRPRSWRDREDNDRLMEQPQGSGGGSNFLADLLALLPGGRRLLKQGEGGGRPPSAPPPAPATGEPPRQSRCPEPVRAWRSAITVRVEPSEAIAQGQLGAPAYVPTPGIIRTELRRRG